MHGITRHHANRCDPGHSEEREGGFRRSPKPPMTLSEAWPVWARQQWRAVCGLGGGVAVRGCGRVPARLTIHAGRTCLQVLRNDSMRPRTLAAPQGPWGLDHDIPPPATAFGRMGPAAASSSACLLAWAQSRCPSDRVIRRPSSRHSICMMPVLGSGKARTRFRPHSPAL